MKNLKFSSDVPEIEKFMRNLTRKCRKYKIHLNLVFSHSVVDEFGEESAGYFDGETLSVAMDDPNWLQTIIHESCHLDQMIENVEVYTNYDKPKYSVWDWLGGKELSDNYINKLIQISRDCELDCEKRSVKKIKKFKLPIDIERYTQMANAYILFYNYIGISRKWYIPGKEPSKNPEIIELMSTKFDMDYKKLDPELIDLFEECVSD